MLDLAPIKRREAAASPAPWSEDDGNIFCEPESQAAYEARSHARMNHLPTPPHDGYEAFICTTMQKHENFENNAYFIQHARTDVPLLIQEVEGLRKEKALLSEAVVQGHNEATVAKIALTKFGRHLDGCTPVKDLRTPPFNVDENPCTCGFDQARGIT